MKINLKNGQEQEHAQTGYKLKSLLQVGCHVEYFPGTFFCYGDDDKIDLTTDSQKVATEWGNYNHCW